MDGSAMQCSGTLNENETPQWLQYSAVGPRYVLDGIHMVPCALPNMFWHETLAQSTLEYHTL
jgi:hypothetical protein